MGPNRQCLASGPNRNLPVYSSSPPAQDHDADGTRRRPRSRPRRRKWDPGVPRAPAGKPCRMGQRLALQTSLPAGLMEPDLQKGVGGGGGVRSRCWRGVRLVRVLVLVRGRVRPTFGSVHYASVRVQSLAAPPRRWYVHCSTHVGYAPVANALSATVRALRLRPGLDRTI